MCVGIYPYHPTTGATRPSRQRQRHADIYFFGFAGGFLARDSVVHNAQGALGAARAIYDVLQGRIRASKRYASRGLLCTTRTFSRSLAFLVRLFHPSFYLRPGPPFFALRVSRCRAFPRKSDCVESRTGNRRGRVRRYIYVNVSGPEPATQSLCSMTAEPSGESTNRHTIPILHFEEHPWVRAIDPFPSPPLCFASSSPMSSPPCPRLLIEI